MKFLIISGLSGSGKSSVASALEDIGYYCVDNMPAVMMPDFAELCLASKGKYEKVALVTDVRGGAAFDVLFKSIEIMETRGCRCEIVFVEAGSEAIVRRYKETRRSHPIQEAKTLEEAVELEREMLRPVRDRARYIINTTSYNTALLRGEINRLFSDSESKTKTLSVFVRSFGYKHGIPIDADLVFDVRFLPNPYYVESLKKLTGLDKAVSSFVFDYNVSQEFMTMLQNMITFLLPQYVAEGKTSLVIAIGCTGGQHRSVAVAEKLGEFIKQKGYPVAIFHREINA